MGFEEFKALTDIGGLACLSGVLYLLSKKLMEELSRQRKQHALERLSQETRHREERDKMFASFRSERKEWTESSNRNSDKLADAIERALRNRP